MVRRSEFGYRSDLGSTFLSLVETMPSSLLKTQTLRWWSGLCSSLPWEQWDKDAQPLGDWYVYISLVSRLPDLFNIARAKVAEPGNEIHAITVTD